RRQGSRKRRLVLVVVPAAVVLAVGAALVHGVVSTDSTAGNGTAMQARLPHTDAKPVPTTTHSYDLEQSPAKVTQSGENALSPLKGVAAADAPTALYRAGAVTIPKNRLVHAVAS